MPPLPRKGQRNKRKAIWIDRPKTVRSNRCRAQRSTSQTRRPHRRREHRRSTCDPTAKRSRRPRHEQADLCGGGKQRWRWKIYGVNGSDPLPDREWREGFSDRRRHLNPDVFKSYKDEVDSEIVNLDDADGWVRFVDICDEHKDSTVVVNTAARNNIGVAAYGGTLSRSLEELERELVTLWVINRQRDSLELLGDYMDAIPNSTVHVAKNGYFGSDIKFELYNNSNVKKAVEAKNGLSVFFPDMADRVSDDLYSNRLSIGKGARSMSMGNRAELRRWLGEAQKVLESVTVRN